MRGAMVGLLSGLLVGAPAGAQNLPSEFTKDEQLVICRFLEGTTQALAKQIPEVDGRQLEATLVMLYSTLLMENQGCWGENDEHLVQLGQYIFPLKITPQ